MNNAEEARIWLKKAVQTSDMYICSSAYQLLYEIEKRTNHPDTAVKYAEYYIQCKDSLDKQISVSSTIRALGQNYEKERLPIGMQYMQLFHQQQILMLQILIIYRFVLFFM